MATTFAPVSAVNVSHYVVVDSGQSYKNNPRLINLQTQFVKDYTHNVKYTTNL